MDSKLRKQRSKFLSFVLRHRPDAAGVVLDSAGWVNVDELLAGCAAAGWQMSRGELEEIVVTSAKQRFAFSREGTRLRASQGHSVPVDLGYQPAVPPDVLFHGTVASVLPVIKEQGLSRMERHHVHLSPDRETAVRVGGRRGRPVVLEVDARGMHAAGHQFFRTANGVWLTEGVPPGYIRGLP